MHRNPFWIFFLSALFIGTIIYTGIAVYDLWHYFRLDKQTQAHNIQWSVLSLNDDRFIPYANYQYSVLGKSYSGETRWNEGYLNEWAAKEAVERLRRSPPPVWYDGSHPAFSTTQKLFPLKACLYTGLLWGLTLYFFGLGYYTARFYTHRE